MSRRSTLLAVLSLLVILVGCSAPPTLDQATLAADARGAAGGGPARVHRQTVLVEHPGHRVERMVLYLASGPRGTVLVDPTGARYPDLDTFRATNHLLTADDTVRLPEPPTDGRGAAWVDSTGHTGPPLWVWRLAGTLVLTALAGSAIARKCT